MQRKEAILLKVLKLLKKLHYNCIHNRYHSRVLKTERVAVMQLQQHTQVLWAFERIT